MSGGETNCVTQAALPHACLDRCLAEQPEQFHAVLRANGCIVEMLRLSGGSYNGSWFGDPTRRRAQNQALLNWMNCYVLGIDSGTTQEVVVQP